MGPLFFGSVPWLLTAHVLIVSRLLTAQVFFARFSSAHVAAATLVASGLFIVLVVTLLFFGSFFESALACILHS